MHHYTRVRTSHEFHNGISITCDIRRFILQVQLLQKIQEMKFHSSKIFAYKNIIVFLYMYQFSQLPMVVIVSEINNVVVFFTICKKIITKMDVLAKYPIRRGSCRFQFASGKVEK
jgi:hypothetical protein